MLDSKEQCRLKVYYNEETKNFAIEDPALFYFIKHLDWERLRADCGFSEIPKDREWDVAISFAGENRNLARFIAEKLEFLDVHVFFDEHYEDNYLGKPGVTALGPFLLTNVTTYCASLTLIIGEKFGRHLKGIASYQELQKVRSFRFFLTTRYFLEFQVTLLR